MTQLRNTKQRYGLIAIWLHWFVAIGFLGTYTAVYYRHWFSTGKFNPADMNSNTIALYLHLSFGITVAAFVVLRIIWKSMNKTPADVTTNNQLENFAARSMHWILYAVMIVMPLTGYLGTKLNTNYFFLFEIPKFNDLPIFNLIVEQWLGTDWKSFESVMDAIHKNGGAYVVWGLIAIHAGAALYHHYIRKDEVLKRMISVR